MNVLNPMQLKLNEETFYHGTFIVYDNVLYGHDVNCNFYSKLNITLTCDYLHTSDTHKTKQNRKKSQAKLPSCHAFNIIRKAVRAFFLYDTHKHDHLFDSHTSKTETSFTLEIHALSFSF